MASALTSRNRTSIQLTPSPNSQVASKLRGASHAVMVGRIDKALFRRMGELGFLGLRYDPRWGGQGLDARFSAETLYTDRNIFVVRKQHPWAGEGRLELKRLIDAEWAIIGPFCRLWNELRDMYAASGLAPPRHSMESNSVELCVQQLLNDDYVSFLPARLVSAELRSGVLVAIPVRQPKPRSWHCLLVMRADSKPGPTAAEFIETVRSAAKNLPRL